MKKYIPITEVKFDRRKHKKSKWITTGLIKSINYRDKLYSKLKKTKVESEKYQSLKINLKTYNNILKRAIKEAKTNYYDYNFTQNKNDSKKCWTMINEMLGRTKTQNKMPDKLVKDNCTYFGYENVANCFNEYFVNVGKNLAENIKDNMNNSFKDYLKHPTLKYFEFKNVTEKDIIKVITNLKTKAS